MPEVPPGEGLPGQVPLRQERRQGLQQVGLSRPVVTHDDVEALGELDVGVALEGPEALQVDGKDVHPGMITRGRWAMAQPQTWLASLVLGSRYQEFRKQDQDTGNTYRSTRITGQGLRMLPETYGYGERNSEI